MLWLKTLALIVVSPGTIDVLLPWLILRATHARPPASIGFLQVAGAVLVLVGAGFILFVAQAFVRHGRGTPIPLEPPKNLVTHGLFCFTRNPMFLGMVTIILGEALVFRSPALLAYAGVVFLGLNAVLLFSEEPDLRRRFGSAYGRYVRITPRWVGKRSPDCAAP